MTSWFLEWFVQLSSSHRRQLHKRDECGDELALKCELEGLRDIAVWVSMGLLISRYGALTTDLV